MPTPRAPVDLARAETKVVRFGLHGPRSTICPGEPTPLSVGLDAVLDGDEDLTRLVPHRHEIDDWIFDLRQLHVTSPQGVMDSEGVFRPNDDVVHSVQTGFVLHARPPRGPAFAVRFPPSYECTATLGRAGAEGVRGFGPRAASHADPVEGVFAAADLPAANGLPGGIGGEGASGPRLRVFVTWVRTPDYTKLLAARSEGDVDRVTLVAPGTPLSVLARGGAGGTGGRGAQGAAGLGSSAGGGPGGDGGAGGAGGRGGDVEVFFDERFDDLERMIRTDVRGGDGGAGGRGGEGGEGAHGDPIRNRDGNVIGYKPSGPTGRPGAIGPTGPAGQHGTAKVRSFSRYAVAARFDGLGAIVPY